MSFKYFGAEASMVWCMLQFPKQVCFGDWSTSSASDANLAKVVYLRLFLAWKGSSLHDFASFDTMYLTLLDPLCLHYSVPFVPEDFHFSLILCCQAEYLLVQEVHRTLEAQTFAKQGNLKFSTCLNLSDSWKISLLSWHPFCVLHYCHRCDRIKLFFRLWIPAKVERCSSLRSIFIQMRAFVGVLSFCFMERSSLQNLAFLEIVKSNWTMLTLRGTFTDAGCVRHLLS